MPWWAPLAKAGITAVGGYLASRAASKQVGPSASQKELERIGLENVRATQPYGLNLLKKGTANIDFFNDFYGRLARGGHKDALSLLAPQFSMMDQQAAAADRSRMMLAPRGGGSAEGRLQARDDNQMARNNAILGLRTGAVDKLGDLGTGMLGAGGSLLGQSSNGAMGLLGSIQSRKNSEFDIARQAGSGIMELLKGLLGGAGDSFAAYKTAKTARTGQLAGDILRNTRWR